MQLAFSWCRTLATALCVGCAGAAPEVVQPTADAAAEAGLEARLGESLRAREYWASPSPRGLQAPNRRHGLRTVFGADGIRVFAREAREPAELLGLRLEAWGREGALSQVGAGELAHERARVELHRPGLVEWFDNRSEGLEHGFHVSERPAGDAALVFSLRAEGAEARLAGGSVRLSSTAGRTLAYGKLLAWDASGTPLETHFSVPAPDRVEIVVADAGAVYPIEIDPLLTATADASIEGGQALAQLGYAVAGAGDVDGDGYGDVIVGAPGYDAGQSGEGAVFLFLGGASGIASGDAALADAVLEGDQDNASLGRSVSSAGDVNGDGYSDLIVGASLYDAGENNEGAAFVFLGGASGIASGGPASAHAQLEGDQVGAVFGASVSGAGDIDGDGYADVIVGASSYDAGEQNEGAAFVFLGSAVGIASGGAASASAQLESDQADSLFGASVSGAGDVNADGFADVIVGASDWTDGETDEGAAFLFHGSAAGIVGSTPLDAATQLEGNQSESSFGTRVSGAGDVDGDGYADVLVGAQTYDSPESNEGAVFLYLGGPAGVADGDPSSAATHFETDLAGSALGSGVASAGDVNGDGYGDVVVGAGGYSNGEFVEGAIFVFLGSSAGIAGGLPTDAFAQIESNQFGAVLGFSAAGAGDVNGDGYADVIAGAFQYTSGESQEGAAFVYLGGATGVEDGDVTAAAAEIASDQLDASFAGSVASAGDVNGDGFGDLIVGAYRYEVAPPGGGAAFLFLGSAEGVSAADPSDADAVLASDQAGAGFGISVASAGDVNGDGYDDVIVGASLYEPAPAAFLFLGSASGIASGGPATADATLTSDQPTGRFGQSVASAGDVNGDGFADVVVGDYDYGNGGALFVFHGSAVGIADGDATTAATAVLSSEFSVDFGGSVASAGDVDGDGYADLIAGASEGNSGGGSVYVFLGGPDGVASGSSDDAHARIDGLGILFHLGHSVSTAGDVNGDGYSDVIIGSVEAFEFARGGAFLFHGSASGIVSGDSNDADTYFVTDQLEAQLGTSVSTAGDLNADGYADVIVNSSPYDAGEENEGAVFVFLGSAAGIPSGDETTAAARLESNQASGLFGFVVSTAGDVNADGYADLLTGSFLYDPGTGGEGAAHLFLGNGLGRPLLASQRRGDGSGVRVAPWGSSLAQDGFEIELVAKSPRGRESARIEVQVCPAAVPFEDASCLAEVGPWVDLVLGEALLTHDVSGLDPDTRYRWRARTRLAPLHAITPPPLPPEARWYRYGAQSVEADIRTLPEPGALAGLGAVVALALLARRRRRAA